MDINQNNYESFFLLYVDNELSAAERLCVEAFIQDHPYLAEELQILQNMVLPAAETTLLDKTALYRSASLPENMEEAMLLQLDNELPEAGCLALQTRINEDETISGDWELLKRTKLDANDEISFPHKQGLYRREPSGALVYGRFTRWAVAAALIAGGLFWGIAIVTNQGDSDMDIANVTVKRGSDNDNALTQPQKSVTPANETKQLPDESNSPAVPALQSRPSPTASVAPKNVYSKQIRPETSESVETTKNPGSKLNPESPANSSQKQQQVLVAASDKLNIKKPDRQEVSTVLASVEKRPKRQVEIIDRDLTPAESTYAFSTLMEEPQQNDNHILFMDEEDVARTKAGIFFKKLKRTVTRSTNIKTGNSLKIAGFEFAIK